MFLPFSNCEIKGMLASCASVSLSLYKGDKTIYFSLCLMEIKLFHKIFRLVCLTQSMCLRVLHKIVTIKTSRTLYNTVESSFLLFPNNALIARSYFLCFCFLYSFIPLLQIRHQCPRGLTAHLISMCLALVGIGMF